MSVPLFFGTRVVSVRDVEPGDPPANFKNTEAIANWRAKEAAKLRTEGALIPTVGSLAEVVILDLHGEVLLSLDDATGEPASVSRQLVIWLHEQTVTEDLSTRYGPGESNFYDYVLVGFNLKNVFKVASMEVLTSNKTTYVDDPIDVPVGLWHGSGLFVDPYEALVPSPHRGRVSMANLSQMFDVNIGAGVSVKGDASLARMLSLGAQLFG